MNKYVIHPLWFITVVWITLLCTFTACQEQTAPTRHIRDNHATAQAFQRVYQTIAPNQQILVQSDSAMMWEPRTSVDYECSYQKQPAEPSLKICKTYTGYPVNGLYTVRTANHTEWYAFNCFVQNPTLWRWYVQKVRDRNGNIIFIETNPGFDPSPPNIDADGNTDRL